MLPNTEHFNQTVLNKRLHNLTTVAGSELAERAVHPHATGPAVDPVRPQGSPLRRELGLLRGPPGRPHSRHVSVLFWGHP